MPSLRYPSWPRYGAAPRPGAVAVPLPLAWPMKSTTDVLDYGIDLTAWLADVDDIIDTAAWTIAPTDVTLGAAIASQTAPGIWVNAGGTAGVAYTLTMSLVTALGRQLSVAGVLPLVALNGQVVTPSGVFLVDGAGDFMVGPGGVPLVQG